MKRFWLVAGILCAIIYAALRLITLNSYSLGWLTDLRSIILVAAVIILVLATQQKFTLDDIHEMYRRQARASLLIGLICLILIPIAVWVAYVRYYATLINTGNS